MADFARSIAKSYTLHSNPSITRSGYLRRLALAAVLLGGSALIAWTSLGAWELPSIGPRQPDYYNLLVAGFRKGTLALDIEVPAQLKEAKDPIELVEKSAGLAPHDVSYYKGRFYTYYGVVPAVVLFWPFRVLIGHELPLVMGSLVFAIGAFALMAFLWLRIVGDHFPNSGLVTRIAGAAALCLSGGQLVLARRVSIWEPSIEAGNFFLACMLASGYLALRSRRPWAWLSACGLALGLATGSRPTLLVAGLGIVPLVVAIGRGIGAGQAVQRRGRLLKAVLATGLPLGAVGIGLLAYNWARFDNPLEFGLSYQFSTWNQVKKSHFRAAFVPFNSFLYFLVPPQWGRYFPFVHPIDYPKLPEGYYGYEYVYGALVICPVLWWTPCVVAFFRRAAPDLRSFICSVFAIAAATTFVLLCFDTAAARYETDFLPWWVFLALLGWGLLEDRMAPRDRSKAPALLRSAFAATAAVSCMLSLCCSAELHEILQTSNPGAYLRMSKVFNMPTALWETLSGYRGGAVEMNLTFAKQPTGTLEPLVVTGVEYQRDYVYIYYQRADVVRFCYVHPGEPVASTGDISVEPGKTYPLRVECGSLYPPEGHSAYNGWQPEEIALLKRSVRVDFNGKTVLIDSRGWNEASPGTVQIGVDSGTGYCGRRFAGTISDIRRPGWRRPLGDIAPMGDFNFVLALPSGPTPLNSPLVTAGQPGGADILGLNVNAAGQYRFYYESWGLGMWPSDFMDPPADRVVSMRIRLGSALQLDPQSPLAVLSRSVVVWKDGTPVWWRRTAAPVCANPPLHLFSNSLGSSTLEPVFRGGLVSANRAAIPIAWRSGPFRAVELQLGGRGVGSEPLAATGRPGHSDTLGIDWLGKGRARLVYDHRGNALRASESFEWQDSTLNSVRVELPSFGALDRPGQAGGEGRLRAWVGDAAVWDTMVPYFGAESGTVSLGRNAALSAAVGAELRSVVVDLRQVFRE
jgi:hypothetical protein